MVNPSHNRTILFVTYGGGHVDIILRLLPALKQLKNIEVKILALTTASPPLTKNGWQHARCLDYLSLPGYENAARIGKPLSDELWDPSSEIEQEESEAYLGISMIDLINDLGEKAAQAKYRAEGRTIFCPRHFMRKVLYKETPDMVVTTCHVRMERAATIAARELNIQSIRIEDLFGYSILGEYSNASNTKLLPQNEWPDDVIVLNNEVKRRLVNGGFPSNRIHAFGQPVFSEWAESFDNSKPDDSLSDYITSDFPTITYVSPARRDILYAQASELISIAKKRTEWRICIKLHPSVSKEEFLKKTPHMPSNIILMAEEDILGIIKASTLVIIFRSTVGMLCLIGGVPLLVADDTNEDKIAPYASSDNVELNKDLSNLEQDISKALAKASSTNHANDPLFDCPSNATARIVSWLSSQASKIS